MQCKICNQSASLLFKKRVMNKYDVKYYKCGHCYFVQTEEPYWLDEAYENIITSLDIGLVGRNTYLTRISTALINQFFNTSQRFLDYGGGYGLFVRMMRDNGFDFYRQDKFCENIFAKNFDLEDAGAGKFGILTAFELFEHLSDPIAEIKVMLNYSNNIFFSTDLQPSNDLSTWEYLIPETGQHIALYNIETLKVIARKFNCYLYTNNRNLHLLTTKKINTFTYQLLTKRKVALVYNSIFTRKKSLLQSDYDSIKRKLN